MKIVFTNRFFYPDCSATSQLLSDLAFHLAKTGTGICIITSRQSHDDPDVILPSQDFIQGVHVVRVRTTRFGRHNLLGRALDYFTFYLSATWNLFTILEPGDILVAKTDPPLISVAAALVARMRRAKLVNWVQDLFPEVAGALGVGKIQKFEGLLRAARNWSLRSAVKNIAIGSEMAKRFVGEGINSESIVVIHNWSDGQAIQPIERETNDLRREWNLEDLFVVGYSGNLGRAHEFGTILDAAEKLKRKKNIVFLFIGSGAQRDGLENESNKRGLTNVLFKPFQPRERLGLSLGVPDVHLVSLQPELEGLIVPSKFYGIAAAGRPTIFIGDTNGEIPRILREAQCGFSLKIGQADDARRIISELADNQEKCLSLGKRARALFEQRFDFRQAMHAWDFTIQGITNSGSPSSKPFS